MQPVPMYRRDQFHSEKSMIRQFEYFISQTIDQNHIKMRQRIIKIVVSSRITIREVDDQQTICPFSTLG
jgi:hypothetical protein